MVNPTKSKVLSRFNNFFSPIVFGCLLTLTSGLSGQTVTPWLTTSNKSVLFAKQAGINFITGGAINPATITIDPSKTYQSIDGFGFCLTEGSAEVINSLDSVHQSDLLSELFDTVNGIGISVLRISMGASDLSSSDYSYDEVTSGTDVNMTHFSLSGPDLANLVPLLKKILAINPSIKILSTPWSAPRWMKNNQSFTGGSLLTNYYSAYSHYFVKYIDAMKAEGIDIWAITPQNEPENPNNEPSMSMSSTEETNFINNNLGPDLAAAGYSTKIIAYDHNCDDTDYPIYVCKNSNYVDGSAFHLYAGSISALSAVHTATGKNVYFTEQYTATGGSFGGDLAWHIQNVMLGSVLNWARTAIEWNLATNASYGPRTAGGCSTCLGAITVNNSSNYTLNVSYYIVAHMSKVVKQNAVRLGTLTSSGASNLVNSAFKNADGSVALVVNNSASTSINFKVNYNSGSFSYTLAAGDVVSFSWQNGSATNISSIPTDDIRKILAVIPNPTNELLSISGTGADKFSNYVIVDMNGQEYKVGEIESGERKIEINIANLPNGNYIIHLTGRTEDKSLKFIKH